MAKKILLALGAVLVVAGGVAAMAAFEAHVINVTAKIENALAVNKEAIEFGTVFPQEYEERDFIIRLSDSFMAEDQDRVRDVYYKIVQKPKCVCVDDKGTYCELGEYARVNYWDEKCPEGFEPMNDLCGFLSKIGEDEANTVSVDSYYQGDRCVQPDPEVAWGYLYKCHPEEPLCGDDTQDCWIIDLKVPPVEGYVGQDWPESCADWTVPVDGADYGCDLWIEVTDFSYFYK